MEERPNDPSAAAEPERDALRIQAAAVAAQQVALTLEEDRLRQRGAALERQEAQIATHLEDRRRHLLSLQEELRKERKSLQSDRAAIKVEREEQQSALADERKEVITAADAARKERVRLVELRKRLRKRSHQHWQARDAALRRREEELSTRFADLTDDANALQRERAALLQAQLRYNGEVELGRRQLRETREELALAQQQWEVCLNQEQEAHTRRAGDLDARALALAADERELAESQREWANRKAALQREIAGLETRVANQRANLTYATVVDSRPSAPVPVLGLVGRNDAATAPAMLGRLVADLGDERRHLLEQWERLLAVQLHWQSERTDVLADLEATAVHLDRREQVLNDRESQIAAEADELRRRQQSAEQIRCNLEGWRARLAVRETAFDGERSSLLAEVRVCAEAATREAARMREIRRRWSERRARELAEVRADRERCEQARATYLESWRDCQERLAALAQEKRDVATKSLALEQLRQELPNRAPDAAATERRLAKLEQRSRALTEDEGRKLALAQRACRAEVARLEAEWQRLQAEEADWIARRNELQQLQEQWEKTRADAEAEQEAAREELRRLHGQHERDCQELTALRQELERVARLLIGEDDVALPEAERQAA